MSAPILNLVVDVHDLAAIILDCHAQLETRFRALRLVEMSDGTTRAKTLDLSQVAPA